MVHIILRQQPLLFSRFSSSRFLSFSFSLFLPVCARGVFFATLSRPCCALLSSICALPRFSLLPPPLVDVSHPSSRTRLPSGRLQSSHRGFAFASSVANLPLRWLPGVVVRALPTRTKGRICWEQEEEVEIESTTATFNQNKQNKRLSLNNYWKLNAWLSAIPTTVEVQQRCEDIIRKTEEFCTRTLAFFSLQRRLDCDNF